MRRMLRHSGACAAFSDYRTVEMLMMELNRDMKFGALIIPIALLLTVATLGAQSAQSHRHSITGAVVDKAGRPVMRATVYLKDLEGHRLLMKQTDRNGKFSFHLVNVRADHEIYAEQDGSVSQKITIPSSATQPEITVKLTLKNGG